MLQNSLPDRGEALGARPRVGDKIALTFQLREQLASATGFEVLERVDERDGEGGFGGLDAYGAPAPRYTAGSKLRQLSGLGADRGQAVEIMATQRLHPAQ